MLKATMSCVSTWMGDRLGIRDVLHFFPVCCWYFIIILIQFILFYFGGGGDLEDGSGFLNRERNQCHLSNLLLGCVFRFNLFSGEVSRSRRYCNAWPTRDGAGASS
jgi:hypothetical protein